jgi:hypothetical protein
MDTREIDWISERNPLNAPEPFKRKRFWGAEGKALYYRCHYIMCTSGSNCWLVFPHLGRSMGHRPGFPLELKYSHTEREACTLYKNFVINPDPTYRKDWQQHFSRWLFEELDLTLGEMNWEDFWQELDADAWWHTTVIRPQDFYKQALQQPRSARDLNLPCAFAFALPLTGFEHRSGEIHLTAVDWGADQPLWAVWCQCPGTTPMDWQTRFRIRYPIFENQDEALAFAEALKIDLETESDCV